MHYTNTYRQSHYNDGNHVHINVKSYTDICITKKEAANTFKKENKDPKNKNRYTHTHIHLILIKMAGSVINHTYHVTL